MPQPLRVFGCVVKAKFVVWEGKEAPLTPSQTSNVSPHTHDCLQKRRAWHKRLKESLSSRQKVKFGIYAKLFYSDILRNSFRIQIDENTE